MSNTLNSLFAKTDDTKTLRNTLLGSIKEFTNGDDDYKHLLHHIFDDVERAAREDLEIFPVCHHSPSSARFMIKRLLEKQPKVIFLELCEDLQPLLEDLRQCTFPVALQAFALETEGFPKSWSPLSVVAPLTEFSAEYQAITYALETGAQIVLVDRSCDHVFQWIPQEDDELEKEKKKSQNKEKEELDSETAEEVGQDIHGSSVGIQIGQNLPGFAEFETFLLDNANVHHYSEWWEKYIEESLVGEDYETYYQLMYFIGSLYRRLRQDKKDDLETNRNRERYMWQRMKEYVRENDLDAADCIHVCGAFHSVSDVEEFGVNSAAEYTIGERSKTQWLYGLIPSSYFAIEHQFGLPSGTMSLAEANWKKSLTKEKLKSFKLGKKKKSLKLPKASATTSTASEDIAKLVDFLGKVPEDHKSDEKQLVDWCAGIVKLARKNGYLASTADSIAIYQTSILLANMRGRKHPSPFDFKEAAITCLEKDATPKKRNITQLCVILLGGDKSGKVGYLSLPPLAQNVYDQLEPLGKNLSSKTIQRALIDFKQNPELKPCSDLLWKLSYLTDNRIVHPIMGERTLGFEPLQESWDLSIGKYQRVLIELGYEGITVEYVIEKRLKHSVYSSGASAAKGLDAVEKCILFLDNHRLAEELGRRSVELISKEDSIKDAPEIFRKIRKLIHYYRNQGQKLPHWLNTFITNGYSHYCTMLPKAFVDEDVSPDKVAAMTGFVLTLETLALSLGCNRDQFVIAIKQSRPTQPTKLALLWTAELILSMKELSEIRAYFDELLSNPMRLATFPDYLKGFIMALDFTSVTVSFTIELFSKAFQRLPDSILLPWLPSLITTLQKENPDLMSKIVKEAGMLFPNTLQDLKNWQPAWEKSETATPKKAVQKQTELTAEQKQANALIHEHKDTAVAMASLLNFDLSFESATESEASSVGLSEEEKQANQLILSYSDSMDVMEKLLF
ncbi:hypothetical protein FUAX_54360 (plasmid) [Fulvitalea axinellae]|uniref:Uncharacterized protein n=1 Tax=Fulvitalea axinellae TaxID=1182444 RepID=A0AAU9CM16_9BACT|nr:hypothetical protein FUAX_54360 [Fulvitalea axinellae]